MDRIICKAIFHKPINQALLVSLNLLFEYARPSQNRLFNDSIIVATVYLKLSF